MKRLSQQLRLDASRSGPQALDLLGCLILHAAVRTRLLDAATTNFFVETQGLGGDQVLWLEGIREIPA